jgi:hypothetical protein
VLRALPPADAKAGLSTNELIERMAARRLWISPGGKTPSATLYSAMIREIRVKGKQSRFARIDKGRFALASPAHGVQRKLVKSASKSVSAEAAGAAS